MYFTSGSDRAFEHLMQGKPGFDHYDSGEAGAPEDCGDCRFYRPGWKYQFCVYAECPYQPGKSCREKPGLHGDVQPSPAEQRPVPESQGPAFANAVPAGRLGLYAERLVPYQPGKHRRHTDGGVGAGKGRVYYPPAEPGRQGQDGRHGLYHL